MPRRDASRACTRAGMTCAAPRREDTRPARLCAAMFAIGRRHLHLVLHQPSLGRRCASLDGCLAVGAAALRRMRRAVRVPCALRSVASSRARRGVEGASRSARPASVLQVLTTQWRTAREHAPLGRLLVLSATMSCTVPAPGYAVGTGVPVGTCTCTPGPGPVPVPVPVSDPVLVRWSRSQIEDRF